MKSPRRPRVFYGWYIVAAGFLAQFATCASLSSTLAVFFKAMQADLLWTRLDVSLMRSAEIVFSGALSSVLGGYLDRHGARVPMAIGGAVAGAGLLLMSRADAAWQVYLARIAVLTVGLAGMGGLAVNVTISNWFIRLRGRAVATAGTGVSMARIIIVPVMTMVIAGWGWRTGWMLLGIVVWLIVVIPAALIIRRRPEDVGLLPDGATHLVERRTVAIHPGSDRTWTRGQVVRTRAFWLLVFTFGVSNIGQMGFNLHSFPYLTDVGIPAVWAAMAMSLGSVMQLLASIFWGTLIDRFDVRHCGSAQFLAQATGLALFMQSNEPILPFVGYIVFCFGSGGGMVISEVIWANFFGRLSLGVVRGAGIPVMVLFSATGPIFFGWAYDHSGSYYVSFMCFTAALVCSAFLIRLCRRPG